jgi:hypothetical protein
MSVAVAIMNGTSSHRLVLEKGSVFIRLDCVASNRKLRGYYERAGFRHCGDVEVRGAPGQRLLNGGTRVVVSLYERSLES